MQADDTVRYPLRSGYSFYLAIAPEHFYVGRRAAYPFRHGFYLNTSDLMRLHKVRYGLPVASFGSNGFADPPRHVQQPIRCRLLLLSPLDEVHARRSKRTSFRLLQDAPKAASRRVPKLVGVDRYDPVCPFPERFPSQSREEVPRAPKALISGPPHPGVLAQLPQHPVGAVGGAVVDDENLIEAQRKMVEDVGADDICLVADY